MRHARRGAAREHPRGCRVHILDGADGSVHFEHDFLNGAVVYAGPPLGDMDDDGVPEIVVLAREGSTANYGFLC